MPTQTGVEATTTFDSEATSKQHTSILLRLLRPESKAASGPGDLLLQPATRRSLLVGASAMAYQVLLVCGLYRAWYEPADWCSGVWLLVACSAALAAFEVFHTLLHYAWLRRRGTPLLPPTVLKAISCCMVAALLLLVFVDAQSSIFRLNSLGGVLVTLVIAIASSNNWHMIDWVLVARSLVAQYAIAFLFLRWASGKAVLSCVDRLVTRFFSFAADGSEHLFGYLTTGRNVGALLNYSDFEEPVVEYVHLQPVFAFQVFPVILLVGSMVNLLYYTRLMQAVVFRVGGIISLFVGSTICESACAGANVFIGMTQSSQLLSPYLSVMTKAELHSVLTSGFSTINGNLLATLVGFGLSADYLLTACLMSVPSSLLCSKLFYPESQEPLPYTSLDMLACTEASMLEACVVGCRQAIRVLGNIVALSISFLGCIKTFESVLASLSDSVGLNDVTLEMAFGYLMTPLSLAMGVSSTDSFTFGRLVGVKVVSNEFVAYIMLLKNLKNLQRRTVMLATFALCGFGNVCAVGIALGVLGALCPERLSTVADLGFRAMWAGCTASLLNACVVGSLIE
ncbi:putative transporter HI_0519 [Amblyomma americanum]